ncbi:TetR/AcrR family transcriptional regulator [Streptacidiphilus fuscans]|uniref:TetR/AcrR family transcriptional regulator n=1 Tax=Streptacidiphilus fuscans TaxID=2789292 RepID=A0A931FJJ1_9ACTN|nr:TetR/AcrR family transcriptional regulator [Streptacidiphilus fuscans]MBF9072799.1 TetR/AcrR family transcriptional regulator [Streptacidiphilus fuscans]
MRTRNRVLRAAASEIVQSGYHGTTLARVAARADVTLGAVSFHFPTKQALIQEVYRDGVKRTSVAVASQAGDDAEPLQRLADLTLRLASLLLNDDDPTVLACSRLSRDDPTGHFAWRDTWCGQVAGLANRACDAPTALGACSSETIGFLVRCLLMGVEAWAVHAGADHHAALRQLAAAWRQAMPGGHMEAEG